MISKQWPSLYYRSLSPTTVESAVNSITPAISEFRKHNGEQKTQALMVFILNDVIKFFNVGKSMDTHQLVDTIGMIMHDYYYFNLDDFKLCFGRGKRGYYGKSYDRMDGNVIFGWLTAYDEERIKHVYNY